MFYVFVCLSCLIFSHMKLVSIFTSTDNIHHKFHLFFGPHRKMGHTEEWPMQLFSQQMFVPVVFLFSMTLFILVKESLNMRIFFFFISVSPLVPMSLVNTTTHHDN